MFSRRGTLHVHKKLAKRESTETLTETGTNRGSQNVKEKPFLYYLEPAASSAHSDEQNAALSNLTKEVASSCFIYDETFQNFVEEYQPDARRDQSGRMYQVLAGPPCNLRMDWNDPNADYDAFALEGLKCMVEVLEYMIIMGVHKHVFCSSLPFSIWKRLLFWIREKSNSLLWRTYKKRVWEQRCEAVSQVWGKELSTALYSRCQEL